jgi:hypothetical protein
MTDPLAEFRKVLPRTDGRGRARAVYAYDMKAIARRLGEYAESFNCDTGQPQSMDLHGNLIYPEPCGNCNACQAARITELEAERDAWKQDYFAYGAEGGEALAKAEAERDRMAAVVEAARGLMTAHGGRCAGGPCEWDALSTALAALDKEEE